MGIRITGLDTPFGGVSWEYTETAKHGIQELFHFLETKRILTNPIEMEIKSWCASSAIEIKTKIAEILGKYDFNAETTTCLRSMADACNSFLDRLDAVPIEGIIYKNNSGDWEDLVFSRAMRTFRTVFKEKVELLSTAYNLQFAKNIPD